MNNIFNQLQRWIRSFMGNPPLIVFFPNKKMGAKCGVSKILSITKSRLSNSYIFEGELKKSFFHHFDEFELTSLSDVLVIIAHSNKKATNILTNNNGLLNFEWWSNSVNKKNEIKYLFAYVCKGAKVLSQNGWNDIFPFWVSFDEDLHVYISSPRAKSINKLFFQSLDNSLRGITKEDEFEHRIRHHFHKNLTYIYETLDESGGDIITLMHLEQAYGSMVTSTKN